MNDSTSFTDPRQPKTSNGSDFYLPPVKQAALNKLRTALSDHMDVSDVSDETLYKAFNGLYLLAMTTDGDTSPAGLLRAARLNRVMAQMDGAA